MPRILAVDDDAHIRRIVQVALQRAGHEVTTASNGFDALEMVTAFRPELIILDITMPYMDGHEVLKTLKERPDTANIPVIMVTAKDSDADVFKGWEGGVDYYLTKPFHEVELITFVNRVFSGTSQ